MSTFLEKHPKFANALGESGKIIAPICEAAGNIPGFQLLGNIGNGIDKLESISDAKKQDLKDTIKQEMAVNNELEGLYLQEQKVVNDTMQSESKSEHWAQWIWRPIVGLTFSLVIINNYVVLPYLHKYGLLPISIPDNMWNAMLVILGATAAGRGLKQWQDSKNNQ